MTPLERIIKETIVNQGSMLFEDFMQRALYTPDLGYYMGESIPIGRSGDFYTSSSLGSFFGVLMAHQIEEMWEIKGTPEDYVFVEFGGATGHFAKDVLDCLKKRPIYSSLKYVIVELNPRLASRQSSLLQEHLDVVRWIRDIRELGPFRGIIFSNELLDAFPVSLIEIKKAAPMELCLDWENNSLKEVYKTPRDAVVDYLMEYCPKIFQEGFYQDGYRTEVNLRIRDWLRDCSMTLQEGFLITIDYGYSAYEYYAPERNRGTLLCYYSHRVNENPYERIGEQDITAHVNFSSLKRWGEAEGFTTCGYCSQGVYLASLGIEKAIRHLYGNNPDAFAMARLKTLLMPQGMGASHKVLVQYKGEASFRLKGFEISNRASSL